MTRNQRAEMDDRKLAPGELTKRLMLVLVELEAQPEISPFYPKNLQPYGEHMAQLREWLEHRELGIAYESIVATLENIPYKLSGKAAVSLLEVGLILGFKTDRKEDKVFDRR
jgi:hypothetical protein